MPGREPRRPNLGRSPPLPPRARLASDIVPVGAAVAVRTRYLGSWVTGYEVAELLDDGYRLQRLSDGSVLHDVIAFADVQEVRKGRGYEMGWE